MQLTPVEVFDEYSERWIVFEDDPAAEMLKKLTKLGLELIVLPRETLVTGQLTEVAKPMSFKGLPLTDSLKNVIIRAHRLYDCVQYLKDGEVKELV